MTDRTSKPDLANHVRVYTGRLFYDGSYTDEQRWVKAEFFEALRARLAVETKAEPDWKHRAEEAERILSDNMALANRTTRRAMDERNAIIRKLRERYSAIEVANMVGLTRQRVHQILNEAPVEAPPEKTSGDSHG